MSEIKQYNNIFMCCSCVSYKYRQDILIPIYKQMLKNDDKLIILIGNGNNVSLIDNDILEIKCGDLYENLPEKVILGIQYITKNFKFNKLIKVDDDIIINFKLYYDLLNKLPNKELYYGRCNPCNSLTLPSNSWHMNKLSPDHPYNNKEAPNSMFIYNRSKPIQWPSGGIYILSYDVCYILLNITQNEMKQTAEHLYEDMNILHILNNYNIHPTLDKTNKYMLVVLPDEIKNKLSILNHSEYNDVFYSKYSDILSFHIGSVSQQYSIDKYKFTKIVSILHKYN